MAALSFGGYVYFNPDRPLTAQKIYVSLILLDNIRVPINLIPHAITVVTVTVSCGQAISSSIVVLGEMFGIYVPITVRGSGDTEKVVTKVILFLPVRRSCTDLNITAPNVHHVKRYTDLTLYLLRVW